MIKLCKFGQNLLIHKGDRVQTRGDADADADADADKDAEADADANAATALKLICSPPMIGDIIKQSLTTEALDMT